MKKLKDGLLGLFKGENPTATLTTCVVIAVLVLLNVIAFTLTSGLGLYLYAPEYSDLTISGSTDQLYSSVSLGKEVTVTFCMEEDDLKNHDTGSFVYTTALQFAERYDFVKLKFVNMLTKRDENGEFFDFDRYSEDMKGEKIPIRQNSVIFSQGASYRVLTDVRTTAGFADFFSLNSAGEAYAYCGEEVMASMIAWVLHDEHGTAYLTEKHGEGVDSGFLTMLTCAGYYVDTLNLRDKEIPSDAEMVVISNPTTDFYRLESGAEGRSEIEKLEEYLTEGGSLLVMLDPLVKELPVLEGFLKEWGIELIGREDENGTYSRAMVKNSDMGVTVDGYSFVAEYAPEKISSNIKSYAGIYNKNGRVLISRAAAIRVDGSLGAQSLLNSGAGSELVLGGNLMKDEPAGEYGYSVAAATERRNEDGSLARVIVVPTAYLLAADAIVGERYVNRDFFYSALYTFFGAKSAPIGCNIVTYDNTLLENFTMRTARLMTAGILAIPAGLAVLGAVITIKRKNR